MKTMKKVLLLSAVSAVAVCAQAQTRKVVPAGQDYTIGNVVSASGDNVTYKWFRDNIEIPNATSISYTIPANLAKMENGTDIRYASGTRFQRIVYGVDCSGGVAMSNIVVVYFCELIVNGVCWAKANADESGRISSNPWDLGYYFQWNRPNNPYNSTDPAAGVAVSGWNATPDYASTWTNGYPCPVGWRLPTSQDFQNLYAMGDNIYITGGVRGIPAGVNGRFFGYNSEYCTMSNMSGCIFLPAGGNRNNVNGNLNNVGNAGRYWSSEQSVSTYGLLLSYSSGGTTPSNSYHKAYGLSIRCVIDVQ